MLKRRQLEFSAKGTVTVALLFGGLWPLERELNVASNAQAALYRVVDQAQHPMQPRSVKVGDE